MDKKLYSNEAQLTFDYMYEVFNALPAKDIHFGYFVYTILFKQEQSLLYQSIKDVLGDNFILFSEFCMEVDSLVKKKTNNIYKTKPNIKLNDDFNVILDSCEKNNGEIENGITIEQIVLNFLTKSMTVIPSCKELKNIFNTYGLTYSVLSSALNNIKNNNSDKTPNTSQSNSKETNDKFKKCKTIESVTVNLNRMAQQNEIDTIIGRENELERIVHVLAKRQKNNILIVGDSGVGKTHLIKGLAKKITEGKVCDFMKNKTILSLDYTSLMSGTQYRGMLEDKMKNLLSEITKVKDVVLFIDNIHTFVSVDSKSDNTDITPILFEAMNRSDIQIIATTNFKLLTKLDQNNSTFVNKFQKLIIESPSIDETIEILKNNKHYYESFHNIKINDDIVELAVKLTDRYITDTLLPSSVLDVIDECGSNIKIKNNKKTKLNENDILTTISNITNIPLQRLSKDEKNKLNDINDTLKSFIVGQDEAIDKICQCIKRKRIGVFNDNKPNCFLFVGSTGVGKTLLTKKIAEEIFGSDKNLIRFDMSEYSEKNSISKLIGTSPGYIGYDKGGLLTEAVKNKKYCVILFDEIEKADKEIYNLFLQLFDEGVITDGSGQKIDCKNTIIILTSNVGTKKACEFNPLGFYSDKIEKHDNDIINKEIKKLFPPELINRLDEIIFFNRLNEQTIFNIVEKQLNELKKTLLNNNIVIEFNEDVIAHVKNKAILEKDYGARPINRLITLLIENRITDFIIANNIKNNTTISIKIVNDEICVG